MADVSITGLQWFILIPRLIHTGSHRPIDSHSIFYLHQEKNIRFETRTTQPAARGKQLFVSDFSRLLRHAIEKGRGPLLYSKKNWDPTGTIIEHYGYKPLPKCAYFMFYITLTH